MADYTNSKSPPGTNYPVNASDQQVFGRREPLITPEQLRTRHLFGLPLVSQIKDPITGKAMVMTDDILKDYIRRAVNEAELETGLMIFPVQFDERHPWDRFDFASFGYIRTEHRPVMSIEAMNIAMSNNADIYTVDPTWIEVGQLYKGQVNLLPLSVAVTGTAVTGSQSAGGAVFMSIFSSRNWIPSFWRIRYTCGFKDGEIPTIINELIGVISAMKILSSLATTFAKTQSTSLMIDAMSQSISTPGPQLFAVRMGELQNERKLIVNKIKVMYGTSIVVGAI